MNLFQSHWLKKLLALTVILLLSFGLACNQKQQSPKQKNASGNVVVQVIDGDTFVLSSGKRLRILCIDTPELGDKYHDEAKDMLDSLILGKEVSLRTGKESEDRYGRTLAEVYLDTLNVGLSILRAGLAQLYLFSDNEATKSLYLPSLKYAIENGRGLWSLPIAKPEKYYVSIKGSFRFHRPLCQNLKAANPGRLIRLESRREALLEGLSPCRNCRP